MKNSIVVMIFFLPCLLQAQGLRIGRGASMVVQGNARIVMNDASFINDGNFIAGKSNVVFSGEKNHLFVGGVSRTAFSDLVLNSSLQLQSDIAVNGHIILNAGNLELNNRRLDLDSTGIISGENINSRITGEHGGVVTVTAILNAPRSVNPGNIGVELTSDANLGTVVITRGHVQQLNNGKLSIQRYYDVQSSFNSSGIKIKVGYLDAELAGNRKPDLVLWQLKNRFTMGAGATALSAFPNPARDKFTLSYYSLSDKQVVIDLQDAKGHVLERKQVRLVKGLNTQQWNISAHASGTYYLALENTILQVIKQ